MDSAAPGRSAKDVRYIGGPDPLSGDRSREQVAQAGRGPCQRTALPPGGGATHRLALGFAGVSPRAFARRRSLRLQRVAANKPVSRRERLVRTIVGGRSDANIRFDELRALMRYLGFHERVRGSHHLFDKEGIVEIVNLQRRGGHAKPYQVRQVRRLILKYRLGADE